MSGRDHPALGTRRLLFLWPVAALMASASARTGADEFDALRQFIRAQLESRSVPSLAMAVVRDGKIVWEEGFGWADRERKIRSDPHILYSLASISKPITATAVMILKERGKLALDRPINEYLGDAKVAARVGRARDATVRRVANHTAGLPLHFQFYPADSGRKRPPMGVTIRRYGNLVTAPGERYQYSNLGYGILDHVIARVSGQSYADFMREEVFLPLGMMRASVDIGLGMEAYAAARYTHEGKRLPFYDFDHPGGSAIFCSAHDLARFALLHMKALQPDQKAILSESSIDEMQRTAAAGPGSGYGLGWGVRRAGEQTVVSHDGGMPGVATALILIPEKKIAVTALCNTTDSLPHEAARRALEVMLPGWEREQNERQRRDPPGPPVPFRPTPDLAGEWRGTVHTYAADVPVGLRFGESGDVQVHFGEAGWSPVTDPAFKDGVFTGDCAGELGTEDVKQYPYNVRLELRLRKEALNGAAIALTQEGAEFPFALSHWIALRRRPRGAK